MTGRPPFDTTDTVAVLLTRSLPVPAVAVFARLSEDPAALLGGTGRQPASEGSGEPALIPLSVRIAGVRFDRRAAVGFGPLIEEDDGSLLLPLWWEAAEHPGLFPTFTGGLEVRPDDGGAQLRLQGHYQPPLGMAGRFVDRAVLNRAATASLEALLERLVSTLAPA